VSIGAQKNAIYSPASSIPNGLLGLQFCASLLYGSGHDTGNSSFVRKARNGA